jgi:hypothetical protein
MKHIASMALIALAAVPAARAGWLVTYQVNGTTTCGSQVYPWTSVPAYDNSIQQSPPCEGDPPETAVMQGTVRPVFTWQTTTGETMPAELHTGVRVDAYTNGWSAGSFPQVKVTSGNWKPAIEHGGSTWGCGATRVKSYPVPVNGVVQCDAVALKVTRNTSPDRAAWLRVKAFVAVDVWATGDSTDGAFGMPPPFFSGTNCKAAGYADVYDIAEQGPSCFKKIALYVGDGGPIVETPEFPGDCEGEIHSKARFDSTHFPDQHDILVKAVATDRTGKTYSGRWTQKAYNKGGSTGDEADLFDLADHAADRATIMFGAANHGIWHNTQANKAATLSALHDLTAFYSWTHGDPYGFADSFYRGDPAHWIIHQEVSQAVGQRGQGEGELLLPKYNFVFLDACHTCGWSFGLDRWELTHAFGINGQSEDRVFAGWRNAMDNSITNFRWTWRFLANLTASQHAWQAWRNATAIQAPQGDGHDCRLYLHGDRFTKLRGLYGENGSIWLTRDRGIPE